MSTNRHRFLSTALARLRSPLLVAALVLSIVSWSRGAEAQVNALAGRVTSDLTDTSGIFADVTGLSWYVAAGASYAFACRLSYTTDGLVSPANLLLSVNGPASPAALRYKVVTAKASTTVHSAIQTAYDTATNPAGNNGSTAEPAVIQGLLENGSTAGLFTIRYAKVGGMGGSSATILRGSFCTVARQ